MQREIGPLAQLEGVRLDRSRHDPPAAADYPGRALRICEEQRIAHWQASALCADGWALAVSGESGKGWPRLAKGWTVTGLRRPNMSCRRCRPTRDWRSASPKRCLRRSPPG